MKSQIHVLIISSILFMGEILVGQPKISVDLGIGFYEPTLSGFDDNQSVQFPTKGFFNRNMMINWGIYYEFFNNARIGYNSFTSYDIGKNILLLNSEAIFRRSLIYRMFPIETYFRWRPKIELNFTLAPIWGRGRIEMDTTPGDKTEDWNFFYQQLWWKPRSRGGYGRHRCNDIGLDRVFEHAWFSLLYFFQNGCRSQGWIYE